MYQEKIAIMFNYYTSLLIACWEPIGTIFQENRDHVGAMFGACLVVHVISFLGEVCKHC